MFPSATLKSRPAPPSYREWVPEPFQMQMVEHLIRNSVATPWLEPGMRKTSAVLCAFDALKKAGVAKKMLVIAPLRVCRLTWRQEGAKWTQFRHLTFQLLHGPKKDHALRADADIYLINPEGVQWLAKKFEGRPLPFDTVLIDELTRFKNHRSVRHTALRPRLARTARRWGMTGTPSPNGYLDLFGQYLILDDGAALGRYITHYRDNYFMPDFDGFNYILQPGADKRIEARIAPYVISMRAEDYIKLPPLTEDIIEVELSPESRRHYEQMKRQLVAELSGGTVSAANSAAAYAKLSQMANGAVYDESRQVIHLHDEKLDALEDLVEQLQGKPLLLAYEFEHDRQRIVERFPGAKWLGKGVSAKREEEIFAAWNRNEIPLLLGHPASIGHGLNLQEGGASHVAWFSPIWDLEMWDQFIRRLLRSGNTAERVINHIFVTKDSIDELKIEALREKDATQTRLRLALNHAIGCNDTTSPRVEPTKVKETNMVLKLSKQGAAPAAVQAAQQADPAQATPVVPIGWATNIPPAQTPAAQRAVAEQKIAPQTAQEDAAAAARAAFAAQVQGAVNRSAEVKYDPAAPAENVQPEKPRRQRAVKGAVNEPADSACERNTAVADVQHLRSRSLELAASLLKDNADASIEDVLATAQQFSDFIFATA